MPNWTNLSLEKLRTATKVQIIEAVDEYLNNLTKREIMEGLLEITEVPDIPVITKGPDGQIESRKETGRDVLGAVTRTKHINWSYYPSGEIDVITIQELNAEGEENSRQEIKHFLDDRQPQETVGECDKVIHKGP